MNKYLKYMLILGCLLALSACAHHYTAESIIDPYGFFSGIWHGIVCPISILGYFFVDGVYIIGEPNTGFFYYLGFVMGLFGLGVPRIFG